MNWNAQTQLQADDTKEQIGQSGIEKAQKELKKEKIEFDIISKSVKYDIKKDLDDNKNKFIDNFNSIKIF